MTRLSAALGTLSRTRHPTRHPVSPQVRNSKPDALQSIAFIGLLALGTVTNLGSGPSANMVLGLILAVTAPALFLLRARARFSRACREHDSLAEDATARLRLLQSENSALSEELKRLQSVEAELLSTRSEAAAAILAKGQFLATISHEIRTPLNGILPLVDLVSRTKLAPEAQEHVETIQESARELLRIVNDVLDFSKLEADSVKFETQTFSVRSLVDGVGKLMRSVAQQRGLSLDWRLEERLRPTVRGDALRIRQVLTNLVSNAIKFTEHGAVNVLVTLHSETRSHCNMLFTVRDTGIGISTESAKKLFTPFSQADASTTRLFGGTGLGLAISHRLVEGMGGKIGVTSKIGSGSSFWFVVPLLKPLSEQSSDGAGDDYSGLLLSRDEQLTQEWTRRLRAANVDLRPVATTLDTLRLMRTAVESDTNKAIDLVVVDAKAFHRTLNSLLRPLLKEGIYKDTRVLVLGDREQLESEAACSKRVQVLAHGASEATALRVVQDLIDDAGDGLQADDSGPVIDVSLDDDGGSDALRDLDVLLVDDLAINRHVGRVVLEKLGMRVTLASDGREALRLLEKSRYDLVLMDCQMPDIDGYTTTRALRERELVSGQSRLPIIAVTANAMGGDREKCLAAGMDDYLPKPISRAALVGVVRRWRHAPSQDAPDPSIGATIPSPLSVET